MRQKQCQKGQNGASPAALMLSPGQCMWPGISRYSVSGALLLGRLVARRLHLLLLLLLLMPAIGCTSHQISVQLLLCRFCIGACLRVINAARFGRLLVLVNHLPQSRCATCGTAPPTCKDTVLSARLHATQHARQLGDMRTWNLLALLQQVLLRHHGAHTAIYCSSAPQGEGAKGPAYGKADMMRFSHTGVHKERVVGPTGRGRLQKRGRPRRWPWDGQQRRKRTSPIHLPQRHHEEVRQPAGDGKKEGQDEKESERGEGRPGKAAICLKACHAFVECVSMCGDGLDRREWAGGWWVCVCVLGGGGGGGGRESAAAVRGSSRRQGREPPVG